jgi:hypothetical protein
MVATVIGTLTMPANQMIMLTAVLLIPTLMVVVVVVVVGKVTLIAR